MKATFIQKHGMRKMDTTPPYMSMNIEEENTMLQITGMGIVKPCVISMGQSKTV